MSQDDGQFALLRSSWSIYCSYQGNVWEVWWNTRARMPLSSLVPWQSSGWAPLTQGAAAGCAMWNKNQGLLFLALLGISAIFVPYYWQLILFCRFHFQVSYGILLIGLSWRSWIPVEKSRIFDLSISNDAITITWKPAYLFIGDIPLVQSKKWALSIIRWRERTLRLLPEAGWIMHASWMHLGINDVM